MSHEVETMAWAGERPWHGLGVEIPDNLTPAEIAHKAGLDWSVNLHPMRAMIHNTNIVGDLELDESDLRDACQITIPNQFALVRSTDNKVLTVVGERWNPVQNTEALKFFDHFAKAGGARMTTAGSLRGGTIIWGLADLGDSFTVAGKEDKVRGYLLLMSPHIVGRSVIARVTPIRVVCANTLAMALAGSANIEQRFPHTSEFDPKAAADAMGLVREEMVKFGKLARQLAALRLSEDQVLALVVKVFHGWTETPVPEKGAAARVAELRKWAAEYTPSRTVTQVLQSYATAPGADVGTGWGVLNAATHWTDHVAGRDADARLTSAWIGRSAARKQSMLDELTALVT